MTGKCAASEVLSNPTRSDCKEWKVRERRAVADHEAALKVALGDLAASSAPVTAVNIGEGGGVLTLSLREWRLTVAPTTAVGSVRLAAVARAGGRLVASGRYGPRWWVTLHGTDGPTTVLTSHLTLLRWGSGPSDDRAQVPPIQQPALR